MKIIIFLCLILLVFTQQVLIKNACNACEQLKSQNDCTGGNVKGCEWVTPANSTATVCQTQTVVTYQAYCPQVSIATCATTLGCANIDQKCTHFAGCSAYAKITSEECQAISDQCVSDGTACIVAGLCIDYKTQAICESTPSISGVLKCKWDSISNYCRDYDCSEADQNLITDTECSNWLSGCVTRGKGCWTSPLPLCSAYTGDATTCITYFGSDGNCELQTGTSNCTAKVCTNASATTATDSDCQLYQKGCLTTGKGCIFGSLQQCSTYQGDNSTCVGYIGSDGVCEGDVGGSQCRARKCENATSSTATDADCAKYKTGCKTTGKGCIETLGLCSSYQGTTTTCVGYIGTDGFCKGTSTTTGNCAPKVCEEAPATNTTQAACASYQVGCKSTGQGCVKTLSSCSSYTGDASSCASRIGSEGNCTWASGTNCVARSCASAALTMNSNNECAQWFNNCVSNGAGCVSTTTCDNTIANLSCQGTTGCSWQSICTSNAGCSSFQQSVSICAANKARVFDYYSYTYEADGVTVKTSTAIYKFVSCAWRNGSCVTMECSDITGPYYATDANCAAVLTGCISNRKDACILPTDCSKLTGTIDTCKGYSSAYCTNSAGATDTTPCVKRQCTDNTTATDTPTCNSWYPGCIYGGSGCVVGTTTCSQFQGTQTTCDGLYGWVAGTTYQQCYNASTAQSNDYCVPKTCILATGKTSDSDCSSFLTGCIYDGSTSCIDSSLATCDSFNSGSDGSYCDKAIVTGQSVKYCYGSAANTSCKTRACSDNTTAADQNACDTFKSGCIFKSGGGCDDYSNVRCESQQGTPATCPTFFGSLASDPSFKIRCTKIDPCRVRDCSDITNPTQSSDCTGYKSNCRFVKSGTACVVAAECNQYNLDATMTNGAKFTYCTTTTNNKGNTCGFIKDSSICSDRTCDQFLATYTTTLTCSTYIDTTTTGSGTCTSSGTSCVATKTDCSYAVDTTALSDTASRLTFCQTFTDSNGAKCTYAGTTAASCVQQLTCETIITSTDAQVCNDFLPTKDGKCQKGTGSGCVELLADCTAYVIPTSLTSDTQKQAYCSSLKAINDLANLGTGKAVYKTCAFVTGANCSYQACDSIASVSSQADCEALTTGCYYYNGKCQAAVASCPSIIPATLPTTYTKALYCMSFYETGKGYCQINDAQTACVTTTNTDCAYTISASLTTWNGVPIDKNIYCKEHSDKTKKINCIKYDDYTCKAGSCSNVPTPTNQADCDKYVLGCVYQNAECVTPGFEPEGNCVTKVPPPEAITADEKIAYCQTFLKLNSKIFCTYDSLASPAKTTCEPAERSCLYYLGTSVSFCQSKVTLDGYFCSYTTGQSQCGWFSCSDITAPVKSQIDCDQNSKGVSCRYFKGKCLSISGCSSIPAVGTTDKDKQAYCDFRKCTYFRGDKCELQKPTCRDYYVFDQVRADKISTCGRLTASTDGRCTFLEINGPYTYFCAKLDVCTNYSFYSDKVAATACPLAVSSLNYPCKAGTSKNCAVVTCPDNTNATDCTNNAPGCVFYKAVCYTKVACASYIIPLTLTATADKQSWCLGIMDNTGNLCKWDGTKCTDRQCSDVTDQSDLDCSTYLSACKTDGKKCVDLGNPCASVSGDAAFCNSLVDETGKHKCAPRLTYSIDCQARSCYDNVTSRSDEDCNTFMTGCVTRGTGCISNTATCDKYRGTKDKCESFKQYLSTDANSVLTYQYCSGDAANVATSPCKNRVCADNTSATDDNACDTYLTGCVTAGTGCIASSEPCTSYKGTNTDCAKFMGSSGYDYCQGTASNATTSAACRKRLCTDISTTSNLDCYNGMKPVKGATTASCVFDGSKSCVDNNKYCSYFKGNVDTCATYTALDGPCKATTIGTIIGQCAKRICIEAPNTFATDADCQAYHPSCFTTGYGCTTNTSCSNLANQTSCQSRASCTWTNQCKSAITSCSAFNNTSQSQCMNSTVNGYNCVWQETGNICRSQTCADQPGTIKDHAKCQAFSTTCTTSGAGCITIGECNTYTVQSICFAASTTTDGIGRCTWENNACRPRVCSDKSSNTTTECDAFLPGCLTNGTVCVAATSCSDFNGSQQYCQKSKTGPCLYVGGICYNYTKCEDAPGMTHELCQTFSPFCTTNGINCIPITSCAATNLKISCVVGTDGTCGWLPVGGANLTEKCQKFGACTDATGATNDVCQAYGSTCVTEGTTCIALTTCSEYKTLNTCSYNGTDGLCFWNTTKSVCKLKECGDATSSNTTHDGCKAYIVATGSCTTDGIKCIPLSTCSSYIKAGCFTGTDGTCIFAQPVGITTGNKSCRLKECEDITGGITNAACSGQTAKQCVSNGTNCIAKAACQQYTSKTACNGGGLDSAGNSIVCAFTVKDSTNPSVGTCKQFTQCSDANNDAIACATKSSACLWKASGTTTSCTAYACDTITSGTNCKPVPSFDGSAYTVCNLSSSTGKCVAVDPETITDTNCYAESAYTYSWNASTSKCVRCINTDDTAHINNTKPTVNGTTSTYGYFLGAMTLGFLNMMA